MRTGVRRLLLGGVLAATVVATVYPEQDDRSEVVAPVTRDTSTQQPSPSDAPREAAPTTIQLRARTEPHLRRIKDPFVSATAAPLPAAVQATAPPPPPQAPPVPFTYRGKLVENGGVLVILGGKSETYVAKVGDVIEQSYRIDAVTDKAIQLVYLPLNESQTLSIEESKP